jgi:hypothetical protein
MISLGTKLAIQINLQVLQRDRSHAARWNSLRTISPRGQRSSRIAISSLQIEATMPTHPEQRTLSRSIVMNAEYPAQFPHHPSSNQKSGKPRPGPAPQSHNSSPAPLASGQILHRHPSRLARCDIKQSTTEWSGQSAASSHCFDFTRKTGGLLNAT